MLTFVRLKSYYLFKSFAYNVVKISINSDFYPNP